MSDKPHGRYGEPWEPGPESGTIVSQDPTLRAAMNSQTVEDYGGALIAESMDRPMRDQAIACVNACRGISADMLATVGRADETLAALSPAEAAKCWKALSAVGGETMAAVEHTPGPWAVHGEYITRADNLAESSKNEYGYQSGHYVAKTIKPIGGLTIQNANAHLIAAAPDLLEKAKAMAEVANLHALECKGNSHGERFQRAVVELLDIIAKAEG